MDKSIFKSHEPYYNKFINYPFNSLSSLFFLIPILKTTNKLEIMNYIFLTTSSLLWWGNSNVKFKYVDLFFVSTTLFSILNKILNLSVYISAIIYCIFIILYLFKFDKVIKLVITLTIFLILTMSKDLISRTFFIGSLLFKISDTYCGFKYGTALFHIFSAVSIFLFLHL